jgi:hypothetical protein
MIITLLILSILFLGFALWIDIDVFKTGALTVFLLLLIPLVFLTGAIVNGRVIDDKIAMYEEENASIEQAIDDLVTEYMKHETDTFNDLKGNDSMILVSLYPELKSDELVKMQIETYQSNNQKIKDLRESKINISNYKWWLFFGK